MCEREEKHCIHDGIFFKIDIMFKILQQNNDEKFVCEATREREILYAEKRNFLFFSCDLENDFFSLVFFFLRLGIDSATTLLKDKRMIFFREAS